MREGNDRQIIAQRLSMDSVDSMDRNELLSPDEIESLIGHIGGASLPHPLTLNYKQPCDQLNPPAFKVVDFANAGTLFRCFFF